MFGIVNQQRAANHLPLLNTANADLYSIYGSSKAYASAFHDIKTGYITNTGGSPPVYNAGKGYDFATGIGSPRADELIPLLSKIREGTTTPWPVVGTALTRRLRRRLSLACGGLRPASRR